MTQLAAPLLRNSRWIVLLAFVGGLLGSGVLVWRASSAAFTGYTTNPTNAWTSGTVTLTDDDTGGSSTTGTAMFSATGLVPGGAAQSRCIVVTYGGNVAVSTAVKLYAFSSVNTDLLGQWIHLKIEEGTGASAAFANTSTQCNSNFTADANGAIYDSNGGGAGTGTAVDFLTNETDWASGVYNTTTPWAPSANGQTKVYRFTYSLDSGTTNTFQNKNCQITFRWEARTS